MVFSLIALMAVLQVVRKDLPGFNLNTAYGQWIAGYAILSNIPVFSKNSSTLVIHPLTLTDMAKRSSKTAAQQCRYYEVDNIFVYMVETYINGNISVFRELYRELNKDARRDFTDFLLSEVQPTYWREILKQTI